MLLNCWAELADVHRSAVIRLLGNHDVFHYDGYFTDKAQTKLRNLSEDGRVHTQCRRHSQNQKRMCHRSLSFQNGQFFEAIWHWSCRLILQVGPHLFVHAGLTSSALKALEERGLGKATEFVRQRVQQADAFPRQPELDGLEDLLITRDMNAKQYDDDPDTMALRVERLLGQWNRLTGFSEPAGVLIIGHNAMGRPGSRDVPYYCFHQRQTVPGNFWTQLSLGWNEQADGPWINGVVSPKTGQPVLFRVDVSQSRAWRSSHGRGGHHLTKGKEKRKRTTEEEETRITEPQVLVLEREEGGGYLRGVLYGAVDTHKK
jgi:hypothetical protein